MPKKALTVGITRLLNGADKLVQDIERDVGHIIVVGRNLKDLFTGLFPPKDDKDAK